MDNSSQPALIAQDARNTAGGASQFEGSSPRFGEAPAKKRILHVEFDRALLTTRHALLETAGFEVISCFNGRAAREVSCDGVRFDLFLVGHAASFVERADLVKWVRSHFPKVPIVVLRSRETDGFPAGDAHAIADPEELLRTIVEILKIW